MKTLLANRSGAFESRWLAEAIRLREEHVGVLEDASAVAAARAAGGDLEARIRTRAVHLAGREGMGTLLRGWRRRAQLALLLLCGAAVVSGFGAALAVLGDGTRPVNIVWALGGLLGLHVLSLTLWLASLALGSGDAGGALGRVWLWLSSRLSGGAETLYLARALAGLLGHGRLTRWWLGAVTHGVWLCALGGVFVGLIAALSARRYGFAWETTILPAESFVRFVEIVGMLPARVGFALPDAAMVRASGGTANPEEAARLAWSSWLVGCVVIYGLVPRLLLWAGCFGAWRIGRVGLRLDTELPGYALLRDRLAPASEPLGVVDAAPRRLARAHVEGAHRGGRGAAVVGLELGRDLPWPPAIGGGVRDAGVLDSREERKRTLALLAAEPPARLLVAVDARLSPDRGSLELIADLSRRAGSCRVWLAGLPSDRCATEGRLCTADPLRRREAVLRETPAPEGRLCTADPLRRREAVLRETPAPPPREGAPPSGGRAAPMRPEGGGAEARADHWREALLASGMPGEAIVEDAVAALGWLEARRDLPCDPAARGGRQ